MEIDPFNPPKKQVEEPIEKTSPPSPFDIVNNINEKKDYMDVMIHGGYVPWFINKSLSFQNSLNCLYANEMNKFATELTPQMQYDFFYHSIPKGKVWGKWHKFKISDNEQMIMDLFGYNWNKAREVCRTIPPDQLLRLMEMSKKYAEYKPKK